MLKILPLLLLAVLFSYSSAQSVQNCLEYDAKVSEYAVQYSFCSDLLTPFMDQIKKWTFKPCTLAQSVENTEQIYAHADQDRNLLFVSLHDSQRKLNIISIRGSMVCNFKNGKQDFDAIPVEYNDWGCKNRFFEHRCRVHQGFYKDYLALRDEIRKQALMLATTYPSSQFLVTGVSLGGAIAALANYDVTMYLQDNKLKRKVFSYNYGEPRIGNKRLVEEFNKQTQIFRVINQQDPVPHLPPRQIGSLMSFVYFYHPGIEVYYDKNGSVPLVCNGDTVQCSFDANKGNKYDVCNHVTYNKLSFGQTVCNLIVSNVDLDYSEQERSLDYRKALEFVASLPSIFFNKKDKKCCSGADTDLPQLTCQGKENKCKEASLQAMYRLMTIGQLNDQDVVAAQQAVLKELKYYKYLEKEKQNGAQKEEKNSDL